MPDTFSSCEITPSGISIKVGTHRRALGVDDFNSEAEYVAAVQAMLLPHLGKDLSLVAANISAFQDDRDQAISEVRDVYVSQVATLEAALAALGTKEEAQEIQRQQRIAALEADISAKQAELDAAVVAAPLRVSP